MIRKYNGDRKRVTRHGKCIFKVSLNIVLLCNGSVNKVKKKFNKVLLHTWPKYHQCIQFFVRYTN